jgi:mannose-1-phosphate guanylyltransferase/mannose-6-phosphate isomerase
VAVRIQPVILCGGSGTRLWPLSRAGFPKQFLSLAGDATLFQQAVQRLAALADAAPPLVVGNDEHRFLALEQLREIKVAGATLLLEPLGRNTAPALTLAALAAVAAQGEEGDPILVVTPADQTVTDGVAFSQALQKAVTAAQDDAIVILGIAPDRPETGYGYIQAEPADPAMLSTRRWCTAIC